MKFNYCPKCGKELIEKYSWDEGGVPYCLEDDIMYFETPKPCIVVAVVKDNDILLLKQSYTYKNSKVLISGYVSMGESIEETVIREVKEETGVDAANPMYLGSEYYEAKEIIMLTFMADYVGGEIKKSSEVDWVDWSNIEDALCEMTEDEIGKRIVRKVLEKISYNGDRAYKCDIDTCQL
ncbi:MAG TPA: NUDIX domain-containing protein [Clostridiaceae bacterium]